MTLTLAIRNPEVVALSGGIKVIMAILSEDNPEFFNLAFMTILYLLENESTRKFLRPFGEIEVLFKK
jgi:hypothetical protein